MKTPKTVTLSLDIGLARGLPESLIAQARELRRQSDHLYAHAKAIQEQIKAHDAAVAEANRLQIQDLGVCGVPPDATPAPEPGALPPG